MDYEYDYGYGELGNQLIRLFRAGAPDFEAAEELIRQGADVNAGEKDDKNILSEILEGYDWTARGDRKNDVCKNCTDRLCKDCEHSPNPKPGPAMCAIIRFFLDHGFDASKFDSCYGAQCLWALTLSTYDRYMIEATKLLLDSGAMNRSISIRFPDTNDSNPWGFIATEGSYQGTCCHNYDTANIFEAVYQIYQAIEDGKPYSGIDSYETAVGKKIRKVLAEKKEDQPTFFSLNLPEFKKDNCFIQRLYFVYDGGVLISTPYADFWTDTILPDTDLTDVSEHFPGIVGHTVENFSFDHNTVVKGRTNYDQPITVMEMNSGHKIRFSTNFGQAEKEQYAAWFEIFDS